MAGMRPLPFYRPALRPMTGFLAILGMVGPSHDTAKARCPNRTQDYFHAFMERAGLESLESGNHPLCSFRDAVSTQRPFIRLRY